MRHRLPIALGAILVFAIASTPWSASAVVPGGNGPIVFTSTRDGNPEIYRMTAAGASQTRLTNSAGADTDAVWSQDRTLIAFVSTRDGNNEIYTMGPGGETPTRVTTDSGSDTDPVFSPDGSVITFASDRDGDRELYSVTLDGQTTTKLTTNAVADFGPDYNGAGTKIVFQRFTGGVGTGTGDEIFTMNADGSGQVNLTNNAASIRDIDPTFSPDGNEIAFASDRDGDLEIFRMGATGLNPTQLTNSAAADIEPGFSPSGTLIAFTAARTGNNEVFSITRTGASPTNLSNNAASDSEPNYQALDIFPPDTTITAGPAEGATITTRTPTFEFTSTEAGSTFECAIDMGAFASCSTPFTTPTLADGLHTFQVRAIDPSNNTDPTPASRSFTVDATEPETTIDTGPADGSTINVDDVTFTFSADETATFECSLDGASFTVCASPQSYNDLAEGSHTFAVRAIDQFGNVDQTPATRTFTVDLGNPETTITAGVADGGLTNDSTPTFEFNADEAATFECSVDGSAFTVCTSPFTTDPLGDGSHTFAVRAIDTGGNVDPTPAGRTFTVDTAAPDTAITAGPAEGSTVFEDTVTFGFNSPDADTAGFECSIDGAPFTSCSSLYVTPSLSDGPHTFAVRAVDNAGNPDPTPATRNFIVDAPPNTTITTGPAEGSRTNDPTPTFEFTASEGTATFECSVDGSAFTACASPFTTGTLSDGPHTFTVRAIEDGTGRPDPTPAVRNFTIDTDEPETTIDSGPAEGSTINTVTPTFTFSSDEPGSTFECSVDGAAFTSCSSPFTTGFLGDGPHTFAVRAIDVAQNTDSTPATRNFIVDVTAPETTIDTGPADGASINDPTPTFTFSSPDGTATFECSVDGAAFAACNSPFTTDSLSDGTHTFAVRAVDPVGNTDQTPATRSFTVDTAAPETTILTGPSAQTSEASPTFTFDSSQTPATFECSVDGGAFTACSSPETIGPLADGPHTFAVRATDAAGNTDQTPASRSFTVDTAAPETTIDSGPVEGSTVDQAAVTITFSSSEAGSTFECSLDGGAFTACTSPSFFTFDDGPHVFAVQATDPAGNTDPTPATRSFVVDGPPNTTIDSGPTEGATIADSTPDFTFSSNEITSTFECSVDGAAFTACTSPFTTGTLSDGSHTFAVRAVDLTNRPDPTPASRTFTVDTTGPETSITAGPAEGSTVASADATFSFESPEATATFECSIDGAPFTICTSPQSYTGLADGSHTFQVRAVDTLGNADATPASRTFTTDTTAPETTIDTGPAEGSTQSSRTASFTYSSDDPAATFECSTDGGAFVTCPSTGTTLNNLADGPHSFAVRAIDSVGNTDQTPDSRNFTVDGEPDTTITAGPADGSTVTTASPSFSFTSDDGTATFECSVDGAAFTVCTSPTTIGPLSEGSHTFAVRAVDGGTLTDQTPASRTFTVDTVAPETSIDTGPAESSTTNDPTPTFTFSSPDGTATFECSVDGGAFDDCTSPLTTGTLSEGSHTLAVRAADPSGNTDATPASRSFSVDSVAPIATIDSGPSGLTNDATPTFGFSSTDGTATFECAIDAGAFSGCSSPFTAAALGDGAHTLSIRASDTNGNTQGTPATRNFTVDATAPQTTIDSGPAGGSTSADNTPTFGFSANEGATFECSLDGGAFAACTSPVSTATLPDGVHSFAVRATDTATNADASPASRTFTIDTSVTPTPPPNPVAPRIAPKKRIPSQKSNVVARVTCPEGTCSLRGPKNATVKVDGETYRIKVRFPTLVEEGRTVSVTVVAGRLLQKILGSKEFRTARIKPFTIGVQSTNGTSFLSKKGYDYYKAKGDLGSTG